MFCPNCGKECSPTDRFCLSCGTKINDDPQPMQSSPLPQEQPVINPVQNTVPVQPASNDVYGGGMYSQSAAYAGAAGALNSSRKKSAVPKALIIIIVAVIVIAVGVGAFFFIRNKMEKDYLQKNPTKYVYSATETFLDNCNADSDLYSIIKDISNQGTISAEISGEINAGAEKKNVNMSGQIAYDKKDKKLYYKIDGGELIPLFVPGATGNLSYELYADSQRMDIAYDLLGQSGKYFVEMGKFREQAENSIFSPSKENVLNISKEEFDKFVDGFESAYHAITDNSASGLDELTDELIAKFEKEAKTTIESGSVNVGGKDISADIVTYTIDHAAMKALMGDFRDEIITYIQKHKDSFGGDTAEIEKNVKESLDQVIAAFDNGANKNFKIELKVYLDSSKKELVKFELKLDDFTNSSNDHFEIIGEFTHDPDMNIKFTLTDGKNTAEVVITKTVNGDVTRYNFEGSSTISSDKITASLEYNKSTKIFTIMAGGQTISGTFEINGNTATIGYDLPVPEEYGKLHLKLDISSEAKINEIKADKNFLLLSKEEFEQFMTSFQNAIPQYSGTGGVIDGANSSSLKADAAMIDFACKELYAGVTSGTINSSSSYIGGLDASLLPASNASAEERRKAAMNLTIYDAIQYTGLTIDESELYQMAVDSNGSIGVSEDINNVKMSGISLFTTFKELYEIEEY